MLFIKRRTNPAAKLAKRQYARVYNINLPGLKLALMMFALFFLCLIIYCCVVEYSETTLAQGVVINAKGDVQVRAKASGTIMNIPIKEGQYVKANQILFSLSRDYGGKEGSVIEYEAAHYLSEIKRNNDRMRNMTSSVDNLKRNLTRQLAIIDDQISASSIKINKAKELVANTQETLGSYALIEKKGYVSKNDLNIRRNDVLNAQLNLKLEESNLLQLQSNKSSIRDNTQYQIDDLKTQSLYLDNRNSEIERTLATQGSKSLTMLAPTDGYVVAINFPPGKAVTQDTEVVVVIRHDTSSPLEGYIYIPSDGAGRINAGDKVKIRFDAWPVDKYGTVTTTLEDFVLITIDTRSLLVPLPQGKTYYLARVQLPPFFTDSGKRKRMLLGGMTLNADIVLDKRPLVVLLLAPLERARQRFLSF
ncbi:HlyD family secretion protein [Erwinia persicina]|uniref:HlyD family efflux transporter periplasmic adaptor subunit n=1 Tax=Erwinia persicina TaxID=55211 RepID=A0ABR8ZVZ9_9GAMM|nr:HlyD family efflux transporter periplasmic adaptor subunit [Erwinia persicina]MBD8107710.1 HlyD family efflux transporter periplasmic adaptor subunit [Erwinia persicina]MBD8210790.1 HlyD family efflux transporter periplasmic adaptor subunit [Erwinia persicina]